MWVVPMFLQAGIRFSICLGSRNKSWCDAAVLFFFFQTLGCAALEPFLVFEYGRRYGHYVSQYPKQPRDLLPASAIMTRGENEMAKGQDRKKETKKPKKKK